ncbi:MAG: LPS assembly lipoprotein LptE [Bacteroidales bacterium]|jgi:hypothetical protein|nr:LPS assembly lipoprotein LptE [Bacteroidales bacterium]
MKKIQQLLIIGIFFVFLYSCRGGYSFTGADISPDVKTIEVDFFNNRASLVQPNLSNVFTETLKDKFISQTNLHITNDYGDLIFEGEITDYSVSAQAYQGNETAAMTRLTISVHVKFTNTKETKKSFDTSFSRYADFDSSQSLMSVEDDLMKQICDELVLDIFNKAVANW